MTNAFLTEIFVKLLSGVPLTLNLTILSLLGGGGLALGLNAIRATPVGNAFASAYVFLFRGTPLLIQIFIIYYGLGAIPFIRHSFMWVLLREPYWCGLLALILNDAAYTSEIVRGAFRAVPVGSYEAAKVVGMTPWSTFRRISFPIALRQALPAYSNEVVAMLKGTALVSTITLMEVTGIASAAVRETWRAIEIFLCAAIIYLFLSLLVTWLFAYVEGRLSPWLFREAR